jgi:hypothetical protein
MKKEDFKKKNPNDWMSERSKDKQKTPEPTKETEKAAVEESESKKDDIQNTKPPKKEEEKRGRKSCEELGTRKKEQYTLTMHPDLYHTLKKLADSQYKSFSQLIADACIEYIKKQ